MMALAPIVGNPYSTVKALYRSAKLSNSSTVKSFLISVCVVILDSSLVSCVRNYSVVSTIHFPKRLSSPAPHGAVLYAGLQAFRTAISNLLATVRT